MFGSRTLNFAHRGFTASAPENSMAAFEAAYEVGADGIELDIRMCKSGELVVFHDPTLRRMTDGRGFIKNKSLRELQALTLMSPNGSERMPTLQDALDFAKGRLLVNIEIKSNGLAKDHLEAKVIDLVKRQKMEEETIISSFNPVVVRRVGKMSRDLLTGYLIDKNFSVRSSEIPLTKLSGARAIHLEKRLAKDKLVTKIRELGYYCVIWSVNEPAQMRHFIKLGVHAIITDKPDLLKAII